MYGFYWDWWFPWYDWEEGVGQNYLDNDFLQEIIDAWMDAN